MTFGFFSFTGAVARLTGLKRRVARKKAAALLSMLLILCSSVAVLGAQTKTCCADSGGKFTAAEMASRAVDFINTKYMNYENIDGYSAYILNLAKEDLASGKWTRDNETLKNKITKLAGLLGDSNSLVTYITATQNADGSFGHYANEYGSKAPLQALAAVRLDLSGTCLEEQVSHSIARAVTYFKNGYRSGSMPYSASGWNFDYRCVEALAAAGEDLAGSEWLKGDTSLMDEVIASAGASAENPAEREAVRLAKEISVINAVYPESGAIDALAGALIAKTDETVPGQVHFGGSVYDNVLVLTALGKAGRLGDIDQDKALAYLDTFKNAHTNSWGLPAGAAWGGYDPEEPDLTAQVLTALSYFDGAGSPGSGVHSAIADGLAYLADIQDSDTAAITAPWDSTFATAETLIALKSTGVGFEEYAGASSALVKRSKTKTIAQCLLAVSCWSSETSSRDRLAGLLAGRQKAAGTGRGSFENSVYSDMWAYIALGEAGRINSIDTAAATDYILSKQGVDGSWGELFGDTYYADVLSTTQALRALTYLSGASGQSVQAAVKNGLAYLKGLQQADGGVYSSWDDPAVDNSELIVTLFMLEKDPSGSAWKNEAGLTPVDYLLNRTMNEDGSFGTAGNVFGAAETLAAYLLVSGQGGSGGGGEGGTTPPQGDCSVNILVVGKSGETIYGPGRVNVSAGGQWGKTALGALHATGLSYSAEQSTGFVKSIAGQANSGMNGWMFKVNGVVPMTPAKDKLLSEGDEVVWWYSTDIDSTGPDSGGGSGGAGVGASAAAGAEVTENKLVEGLPPGLQGSKEALEALENLAGLLGLKQGATEIGPLGEAVTAVVVVGTGKAAGRPGYLDLQNELAGNPVDLAVEIAAAKSILITDKLGEIGLLIPEGAFSEELTVTVKKVVAKASEDGAENSGPPLAPAGYWQLTPVYSLGPEGAGFIKPATLALRLAIPPPVRPDKIVLARYDRENEIWLAVPAVVDVDNAVILTKIEHLSDFAVLARQERKVFEDVTVMDCGWALEPVELLAGAGVVEGLDGRYEPGRPVTRAELTRVLVKGLGIQEAAGGTSFKDITEQDAYSGCIAAAVEAGLVRGYEDGTFRPERAVTREEMVSILVRGLGLPTSSGEMPDFADASEISPWATDSVVSAVSAGLARGYPDNTFRPGGTVTRAECAVMFYRVLFPDF